jgi:hypothetical protein
MQAGKNKATVIISRGEGQMGNRLFQYASFYSASLEKGFRVWNPSFGEYAAWFPGLAQDVFCRPSRESASLWLRGFFSRVFLQASGSLLSQSCRAMGGEVLDITASHDAKDEPYDLGSGEFESLLARRRFLLVRGWKFRARESLWRQRDEVKKVFRPSDAVLASANQSLEKARAAGDLLIGVHVQGRLRGMVGRQIFFRTGKLRSLDARGGGPSCRTAGGFSGVFQRAGCSIAQPRGTQGF